MPFNARHVTDVVVIVSIVVVVILTRSMIELAAPFELAAALSTLTLVFASGDSARGFISIVQVAGLLLGSGSSVVGIAAACYESES